ncbi:MAG TPA: histidine phosphatase family protein [Polyangiaceae bacterium]|nr:histidine phosphatase family protein [Polyangiaceae bacterium]
MKLYLIRHGPAEEGATSGVDADRALTSAGRSRVRGVAKTLVKVDEAPLHILSSQLVRAVQTAEIMAIETGASEHGAVVEVARDLQPGGDVVRLVRELARAGRRRAMLVGHEPDMSAAASTLLGSFDRAFEKSMIVAIKLPPDAGRGVLRFVLDPKALRLDPDLRGED